MILGSFLQSRALIRTPNNWAHNRNTYFVKHNWHMLALPGCTKGATHRFTSLGNRRAHEMHPALGFYLIWVAYRMERSHGLGFSFSDHLDEDFKYVYIPLFIPQITLPPTRGCCSRPFEFQFLGAVGSMGRSSTFKLHCSQNRPRRHNP